MSKKKPAKKKAEGQRLVKCKLCDWTRIPFTTNRKGKVEHAFSYLRSHFLNEHPDEAEKLKGQLEGWDLSVAFDAMGEHVVGEEPTSKEGTPL